MHAKRFASRVFPSFGAHSALNAANSVGSHFRLTAVHTRTQLRLKKFFAPVAMTSMAEFVRYGGSTRNGHQPWYAKLKTTPINSGEANP